MLFPVYVIAELLGLPREDVPQFMSWVADTIVIFHDAPRALAASAALKDYLGARIDERRARPGDDLISSLVGAELDGERLSTDHIVNFLRLLLPAGGETTYRSSGNLLFALLSDPSQLQAVDADRGLLQAAIEEGLRWEPPLTSVNRLCTVDTVLDGVPVPAGAIVECSMAGANRDPARWDDPDRFDVARAPKPHLAFAFGPHTCIGMHLARLETRVALTDLLDRLLGLQFDASAFGDEAPPEIRGIGFRSPTRLPVRFDSH
jgi:cytochrome P450